MELVKGRECGECTVCCTALFIDSPEFQKLPGVRCPHLCESKCSVYATRPDTCRTYYCGWRYLAFLSNDWRPDKSGVLLAFTPRAELPAGYESGVSFILVSRAPRGLNRSLYHYAGALVADGVHVQLAVPGPPGHYPAVIVLNEELKDAPSKHDPARIEAAFAKALAISSSSSHTFKPVVPQHGTNPA